jgi:CBS domain containing-hemolysin-like protein
VVDNKVLLTEVEELTGIEADHEFDTIGGWVAAPGKTGKRSNLLRVHRWQLVQADAWANKMEPCLY